MKHIFIILSLFMATSLLSQASDDLEIRSIRPSNRCANGILDLSINGGTGPYDVVWSWEFIPGFSRVIRSVSGVSGNDGMEDLTNLPPGDYNVVVTDALCGQEQLSVTLQQGLSAGDDYDRIVTEKKNVSDCTEKPTNDGSIEILEVLSVSPGYSISWSGPGVNGNTSPVITNLGLGDYTVTITTIDGCELRKTITICCCGSGNESGQRREKCANQELIFPITIYQEILYSPDDGSSNNGEIRVRIDGGTADNVIQWTGPNGFTSTNPHIRNLGIGTYCITVSDGCSSDKRCFELVSCSSQGLSIGSNQNNTCSGLSQGSIIAIAQGGTPPYQYRWSNGASSSTITNLPRGTYSLTVSDQNGCSTSSSFLINDNIPIRETRNNCEFIYDCNGTIVEVRDIGSFTEVRPSDCRFQDTRCTDGVLIEEQFIGTRFENYNSSNCTVEEACILTGQTFDKHTGNSRVDPLNGWDGDNSCWWCHDIFYCQFPSLDGAVQINNVVSNVSISFLSSANCPQGQSIYRVYCRNEIIWEGCSTNEVPCHSSLLGLRTEEETDTIRKRSGEITEIRTTYKVVDFDRTLVLNDLKRRGLVDKKATLLDAKKSAPPSKSSLFEEQQVEINSTDKQDALIKVFPNPFEDHVTVGITNISSNTPVRVSVFDSFGRVVSTIKDHGDDKVETKLKVDLANLQPGVYFINVSFGSNSFTRKVCKL